MEITADGDDSMISEVVTMIDEAEKIIIIEVTGTTGTITIIVTIGTEINNIETMVMVRPLEAVMVEVDEKLGVEDDEVVVKILQPNISSNLRIHLRRYRSLSLIRKLFGSILILIKRLFWMHFPYMITER